MITGPAGSGKSTLPHLIGTIDTPDSVTISVAGTDITALRRNALADYRASIGFIFQQFHLLPALTLLDNVLAPLVARKTTFDRSPRALELLNAVGLGNRATAIPAQTSGGQQQRVAIARALIHNPGLLLADEPTGNLDSHPAEEILELVTHLQTPAAPLSSSRPTTPPSPPTPPTPSRFQTAPSPNPRLTPPNPCPPTPP